MSEPVTFRLLSDEEVAAMEAQSQELPDDFYEQPCDECGGKVVSTGGHHYYNGSYDCYTMYLDCENCGPYEVECV